MQMLPAHISEQLLEMAILVGNQHYIHISTNSHLVKVSNLHQETAYAGQTYKCYEIFLPISTGIYEETIKMKFMICTVQYGETTQLINRAYAYSVEYYVAIESSEISTPTNEILPLEDTAIMLLTLIFLRTV